MDEQRYKPRKLKETSDNSPFSGLVKCADCGFKMCRRVERRTNQSGEEVQYVSFVCGNYSRSGKAACSIHTIYENVLQTLVLNDIKEKAQLVTYNEEAVISRILQEKDRESIDRLAQYQQEISSCETRLAELNHVIKMLYEDRVHGTVPEGVFGSLMQNYESERKERADRLSDTQSKLSIGSKTVNDVNSWVQSIKKYVLLETLSQEVLLELIECIEVSEAVKIDGKRACSIKIIYRMIGDISQVNISCENGGEL